jgi:ectoine hydroxylase-related dioxygenase (phytanoyl-CoA dioxygenase family)
MKDLSFRDRDLYSQDDIQDHYYNITTRGYSIFESFLNLKECEILKVSMMTALGNYKPLDDIERSVLDKHQIHDLIVSDINYARLLEDQRIDQLIAPFLGESWIMYAATSSSIPPHGKNYASRLHVDSPRFYPGYIFNMGVIWALDDYTVENGALKILPGSQHSDTTPSLEYFENNSTQLQCPAGTLIVFNAKTFHRTCDNTTDNWNHSMTLNACRSFMKQRFDWVRFISEDISCQLNPLAKRLLGYDTRLPTSLNEFFLPEDQRLYKANQG